MVYYAQGLVEWAICYCSAYEYLLLVGRDKESGRTEFSARCLLAAVLRLALLPLSIQLPLSCCHRRALFITIVAEEQRCTAIFVIIPRTIIPSSRS